MNTQTKPGLFTAIALMTLVNGIFNIIWGVGLTLSSFGILLVCFPIALFPIILGAFETAYAMKLLATPPQAVQPSQAIAWWEIAGILVGNVFSMVVGILALVFYNDQTVKAYFAQLNAPPVPPTPPMPFEPAPVEVTEPTPEAVAPVIEESPSPAESEVPAPSDAPAKPKRVRKIAKE